MVELDVKLTSADLYDYNLKHSITSPSGLLGEVLGAAGIIYGLATAYYILAIVGAVLLLYLPVTLWVKTKQTFLLNPVFKEPLHYRLDEEGLTVSQKDVTTSLPWEQIVKVVSTNRSILLYTGPGNATVFPKNQMKDKTPLVIQEISMHIDPAKNKIKA